MINKEKAYQIAQKKMYDNDNFSQWLGIKIIHLDMGQAILEMKIRMEMTNGFGIAHGGISYSLADSALAFAANTHGRHSVSIETSISHTLPILVGDTIRAVVSEDNLTNRIGVYRVLISNQKEQIVAIFKGTVYRTSKEWEL